MDIFYILRRTPGWGAKRQLTVRPLRRMIGGVARWRQEVDLQGISGKQVLALALLAGVITGCSITVPVAVITDKGQVLKGSATASTSGGTFNVADGALSCGGNYDAFNTSITISIPVSCTDGRNGIAIVTRDASGVSGSGRIRMTDGSVADFMFGEAAAYVPASAPRPPVTPRPEPRLAPRPAPKATGAPQRL